MKTQIVMIVMVLVVVVIVCWAGISGEIANRRLISRNADLVHANRELRDENLLLYKAMDGGYAKGYTQAVKNCIGLGRLEEDLIKSIGWPGYSDVELVGVQIQYKTADDKLHSAWYDMGPFYFRLEE